MDASTFSCSISGIPKKSVTLPQRRKPFFFIEMNCPAESRCGIERDPRALLVPQLRFGNVQQLLGNSDALRLRQHRHSSNTALPRVNDLVSNRSDNLPGESHCYEDAHALHVALQRIGI